ncbi:MAG: hypothetical protein R3F59_28345 [Myxococcota bacterium]
MRWDALRALDLAADLLTVRAALAAAPELRRLRVRRVDPDGWLDAALALPHLVELDLVGTVLDDAQLEALRGFAGHVRHERSSLAPGDPLDDVFGQQGHRWPPAPTRSARGALLDGQRTVTARWRRLSRHDDGDPVRQHALPSPVTALASAGAAALVGCEDGRVLRWDGEGEPTEAAAVPAPVRALSALGDDLAVLHDDGAGSAGVAPPPDPRIARRRRCSSPKASCASTGPPSSTERRWPSSASLSRRPPPARATWWRSPPAPRTPSASATAPCAGSTTAPPPRRSSTPRAT